MDYKDILDGISEEITSLSPEDSMLNLRVYKNNIFNLNIDLFKKNYPAVFSYLGERNFIFFVRKLLMDEGVKSPNINVFIKSFTMFLEKNKGMHKDENLLELSKIDKLWSYNLSEVTVRKGMFKFWSQLIGGHTPVAEINRSEVEIVFSYEVNGSRYLSAK